MNSLHFHARLAAGLLFVSLAGALAAEPVPAENPAPVKTEAAASTEIELLRQQIALQQQQIAMLQSAIAQQQQQLDRLASSGNGANPAAPLVASLKPAMPAYLAAAPKASTTLPPELGLEAPLMTMQAPAQSATAATAAKTVAAIQPAGPRVTSHQAEHEHADIKLPKHWYEKYTIRGYIQMRHNRLLQSNSELICQQCDGSTANNNNFIFRRIRLNLAGEINDRISLYFQPDFAVASGNLHFTQVRDAYVDIALDKKKEFRFRLGQSKLPFGWENMQSSQNRLALDRSDALNSAFPNERDLGISFYWAPAHIRARFSELTKSGLKGSGDYGVAGIQVSNGQVLNIAEANNDLHYTGHLTYPFKLKNGQFIEAGIQGYTGKYTVTGRTATTRGLPNFRYDDQRIGGVFVVYPQPWGFQTEFNFGTGPEYNRVNRFIDQKRLGGGYVQAMYMKRFKNGNILIPFYRFTNYGGGKKAELDARHYIVRDHELGVEWQPNPYFEIVTQYARGFRIFEDAVRPNWKQSGNQLRVQFQINY